MSDQRGIVKNLYKLTVKCHAKEMGNTFQDFTSRKQGLFMENKDLVRNNSPINNLLSGFARDIFFNSLEL